MHEKNNSILDISFTASKWDYIKSTREFIKEYLQLNYLKNEDISRVIITASELLENALKYNSDGNVEISLKKDLDSNEVFLTVLNITSDENKEKVLKVLEEMKAAPDPMTYYILKMRDRDAKSKQGGGLGLARIRSEAEAELSANFDASASKLEITAVLKF